MVKSLLISILVFIGHVGYAQYTSGEGDGYAMKKSTFLSTSLDEPKCNSALMYKQTKEHLIINQNSCTETKGVQVFSITGRMVWNGIVSRNKLVVNTTTWQKGIYFLHTEGSLPIKILIQ